MDSLILEKINSGLLYLYSAHSRRDFSSHFESFLAELFKDASFTILMPAEGENRFHVEHSTGIDLPGFERSVVVSRELGEVFQRGKDHSFVESTPVIDVNGTPRPARIARIISSGESVLGLVVFHEPLVLQDVEDMQGLEGYIFDHAFAAFQQIFNCDQLQERLEGSETKLQAISEIGGLLGHLDLDILLSHLIAVYTRLTEAQVGSVVLVGKFAGDVEWGLSREVLEKIRERGGRSLSSIVAESGEPLLVRSYSQDPRFEPLEDFTIDSFLCVPLVSKERILGTVNLVNGGTSKGGMFSEMDKATVVTISTLAATAIDNAMLHRDRIEQEVTKTNLQIARSIQRGMYPVQGLDIPGYDMAWLTRSCDETGGDYFDFLLTGDDHAGFAIGDVSGHGIGAALLMATGRANLRALLSVKSDLKEVMDRLNDLLARDMDDDKFMTLFVGSLNFRSHEVTFVNAGHDQPLLFRSASGKVEDLDTTGLPLGMMPAWSYDIRDVAPLAPGDVLLLTTDGVWEAANPGRERFGKGRLRTALAAASAGSAQEVVDAILKSVESYTQGVPHPDDITLLVLKRIA
jgi:sigma-B regulation protein RsbU (phosphoserine phosphatase)